MTADTAASAAPQKPKRVQSAFFLFTNAQREKVTKELKEKAGDGKFKFGDIAKEISSRWAALPVEEKKVYEDLAAADKQRYVEELRAYTEAADLPAFLRSKYAHLMPKKPATAAARYYQDSAVREKAEAQLKEAKQEADSKQVDAKVREMWKAASDEEKKPFEEQTAKDKAEFFQKQKEWQATPEFAEIEKAEKQQEGSKASTAEADESPKAAAKGRGRPKKDTKDAEKPAAEEATPKAKPAKRQAAAAAAAPASEAKRARKQKDEVKPSVMLDEADLAEAAKSQLEGALRNLAARPEVAASGKKSSDLWAALKASEGLVNPAKRALLGA